MADYEIEMLAEENALVGEGPLWDPHRGVLYWTDIRTGRVFKYNPDAGENEKIHHGVNVGGIAVNRQGGLVFGTWEGVMLWRSDADFQWVHHGEIYQFNDCFAALAQDASSNTRNMPSNLMSVCPEDPEVHARRHSALGQMSPINYEEMHARVA